MTITTTAPDTTTVAHALSMACGERVSIVDRHPNWWASTFPSEVLTCRSVARGEWRVLCKFGSAAGVRTAYGHRHGTAHEAIVYQQILRSLEVSSPCCYGSYVPPGSTEEWLFIEYLGEGAGVDEAASPDDAMKAAARWLGDFHAASDRLLRGDGLPMLPRYDAGYYTQWPRRTAILAADWHRHYPWLAGLCDRAESRIAACAGLPQTVVHGEFTPSNVLMRGDAICPVDWESAAVAFGEIDLVALIEKWPVDLVAACTTAYRAARGAHESDDRFSERVDLAWLYWHFRWLGERADWLGAEHVRGRFEHLAQVGARLGLV